MSGDAVEVSRQSCAHCGRELRQEARFCPGCGHSTVDDGQQRTSAGREGAGAAPAPATVPIERPAPHGLGRVGPARSGRAWPDGGGYGAVGDSGTSGHRGPVPGRYPAGDVPPVELGPPFDTGPARDPASWPAGGRRRRWRPLVLSLVVLLFAGIVAGVLLLLRPSHTGRVAAAAHSRAAGGASAEAVASADATSTLSPQQQAAKALAALLAQSVTDRSAISGSVSDVNQCGPTLGQDAQTFDNAATSRQNLLSQLAGLPARTALSASMLQDLTRAWQASTSADQDLSQWAQDESSGVCTPNDHADPHFQAAVGPDNEATSAKQAFVSQWNPIASEYGLADYQWNQL